jgi:hypothetical protein
VSTIARYCTCGAALKGRISPDSAADGIGTIWDETHSGEGHAPTDRKGAAAARRKHDRDQARIVREWRRTYG